MIIQAVEKLNADNEVLSVDPAEPIPDNAIRVMYDGVGKVFTVYLEGEQIP